MTTNKEITKEKDGLRPAHQSKFPAHHPILNILIHMKNNGKKDCSIKFVDKALTLLAKHANLNNPEEVKHFIVQSARVRACLCLSKA